MTKTVLAIDPGSSKVGMALVSRDGDGKVEILWRMVSPREQLIESVRTAAETAAYSLIIVGSGTTSKQIIGELREVFPSAPILVVDEKDTSYQARERYWEYNPRRGWRRFVPATMQVPPEPVDDFVAFILAERVLNQS